MHGNRIFDLEIFKVFFMINFNGDLLPDTAHFLNHQNRGLRYGDFLCETIKGVPAGLLFWEDHYFRLMASMRRLRMDIPMEFTMEFLEDQMRKTLLASGLEDDSARLDLMVFRNDGSPGSSKNVGVSFIIEAERLSESAYSLSQQTRMADLFRDYYLQADALSGLNHNGKLVEVLGRIYARENGYDTCFLLNHEKQIVGTLDGVIFLRIEDRIKTPPLESGCTDGILRKQLLKLGKTDSRYRWVEEAISPFELQKADEIFDLSVIAGICSISGYRKARYTDEAAAYATGRINELVLKGG